MSCSFALFHTLAGFRIQAAPMRNIYSRKCPWNRRGLSSCPFESCIGRNRARPLTTVSPLANERTFLAWIRTALAVLAGGILLHQFLQSLHPRWLVSGLSVLLVLLATFMAAGAYLRWKAVEKAMRNDQPLPWSYLIPVLSLGLAFLGATMAAFLAFS
jgi:putative membrane protein